VQSVDKAPEVVRFGVFEVNCRTGELRKHGLKIGLQDQPLQILVMLLERPGEVVNREQIQARLWPSGTFVEFEHSIATAIKKLRQALGDDANTPRYVETLPRRGYRFIAPVNGPVAQPPSATEVDAPVKGSRTWRRWIAPGGAALLLAGVAAGLIYFKREEPGPGLPRTLKRLTFDAGLQSGPSWSPDGRLIAYSSDRGGKFDIWVQQVGAVSPIKVTTRPGNNWQPNWSPDGSQIVFRSEGDDGLIVVPALGGFERKISSFGHYPKWSPDGRQILFGNTFIAWLSKIYVATVDGEPPREILTDFLKKSQIAARAVEWYPRSNRVSIWGKGIHGLGFWTVSLDGTGPVESGMRPGIAEQLNKFAAGERAQFRWAPSGRAIYFEGEWSGVRNIWKITVDSSTMRFLSLERLTTGPGPDTDMGISSDGKKLAYAARTERIRVWSYPFDANSGRLLGEGNAVTPTGFDAWRGDISPDGKDLAYVVNRAGEHELWQTSLPDGPTTLLLRATPTDVSSARWSPDSRWLGVQGSGGSLLLLPKGGGSAHTLTSPLFKGSMGDWSPDGRWIVSRQVTHYQPGPVIPVEFRIVLLPLSAAPKAEARGLLVTSSIRSHGTYEGIYEVRLSPNGRWMVFEAVTGGTAPGGATNATLCVVPVSGGPWIRLTEGQFWDDKPRWSPDGRTIFFVSARTGFLNVWGIHFDPKQGRSQGEPFQVTSFANPKLMVADDLNWQSLSLSRDRLILSMTETSGSIWALQDVDK
jgi:Tol biopolymer transport system component/DNA-binding winged helix-turn-helix (wHTH) protein